MWQINRDAMPGVASQTCQGHASEYQQHMESEGHEVVHMMPSTCTGYVFPHSPRLRGRAIMKAQGSWGSVRQEMLCAGAFGQRLNTKVLCATPAVSVAQKLGNEFELPQVLRQSRCRAVWDAVHSVTEPAHSRRPLFPAVASSCGPQPVLARAGAREGCKRVPVCVFGRAGPLYAPHRSEA